MKNTFKILPVLCLFVFLTSLTNCTKEKDHITCNLTYLDRLNDDWKLTTIQWSANDPGQLYEDCENLSCIHFNLDLQDSIYNLSYLITIESDNNIDTFQNEEEGVFYYEYCHNSNVNANGGHYPGGFTNYGDIEFIPNDGNSYTSRFKSDYNYPLELGYQFNDHGAVVLFEPK